MVTEIRELKVAQDQTRSVRCAEEPEERGLEFDLHGTLSETVVHETGYAEFLAALRASGYKPA